VWSEGDTSTEKKPSLMAAAVPIMMMAVAGGLETEDDCG